MNEMLKSAPVAMVLKAKLFEFCHSRLAHSYMLSTMDQAMLSAFNFLLSILLIRLVPKAEFGFYSIFFSIMLFLITIQNAIVIIPMLVMLNSKKDKKEYIYTILYGQISVIAFLIVITLSVFLFIKSYVYPASLWNSMVAFLFASVFLLGREFHRSYYFAEEKPGNVLKLDCTFILIFILFLFVMYIFDKIALSDIWMLNGISAALSCGLFVRSRGKRLAFSGHRLWTTFLSHWTYSQWILAGVIITHLQSYSYLYFIGIFLSSEEVASVTASRLFLMPLVIFQTGWNKIVLPHGTKLNDNGNLNVFVKELWYLSLSFSVLTFSYLIVLKMAYPSIIMLILPETYAIAFDYVTYWALIVTAGCFSVNAASGLAVIKHFKHITKINLFTMIMTVITCSVLIKPFKAEGGLMSLIIGEALLGAILWYKLLKEKNNNSKSLITRFG